MRPHLPVTLFLLAPLALVAACGTDEGSDAEAGADQTTPPTPAPSPTTEPPPAVTAAPEPPEPVDPAQPEPAPAPEPLPGLPGYTAGFTSWDRLNDAPIPPNSPATARVGFDAHTSTKNVRVNRDRNRLARTGAGERRPYPDGTVLVKEGRSDGFVSLVAIMRKISGADPAHGDWVFIEYKRSSADAPFETEPRLMGRLCWSCHQIAEETDWVFTPNDA